MAVTGSIYDNFDNNVLNTSLWNLTGPDIPANQIKGVNQELEITTTTKTGQYFTLETIGTYDLTGSFIYTKLVDPGNQALTTRETVMYVNVDDNNKLNFVVSSNTLAAHKIVAGVNTVVTSIPYNAVNHAWLRIRESAGTIYWDTSANGRDWINLTSLATPIAITALKIGLQAGCYGTELVTSTSKFDSFNITPHIASTSWQGYNIAGTGVQLNSATVTLNSPTITFTGFVAGTVTSNQVTTNYTGVGKNSTNYTNVVDNSTNWG